MIFEKCAVCKHVLISSDVKVIVKAKLVGSAIVVLLQRNGEPDGGLGVAGEGAHKRSQELCWKKNT